MDVRTMLNDGPAPQKRSPSQTATAEGNGSHVLLGMNQSGSYLPPRPASQIPPFGPPPPATPGSAVLTPLKTPSHSQSGNQYPFPTQPSRSSESYSAVTPGGLNTNHQLPLLSPSHYGHAGPVPSLHHHHSTASHSPTPSSHPSQTPHSVRQSPLTTFANSPAHPSQQYPQPPTPLGPPPLIHRASNPIDRSSPSHHRTLSGTSNSITTGSPAQHHPSIGNLVESPSAYHRPLSSGGRTNDRVSIAERERSVSVSPKTKVPPRLPSTSSHRSSQQDIYSARSSLQPGSSTTLSNNMQNHMQSPTPPASAYPQASHSPGVVAHVPPPNQAFMSSSPDNGSNRRMSMSHQPPPDTHVKVEHQNHRISMNHLLSPNNSRPTPDDHHMTSAVKRPAEGEPEISSKRHRQRKYPERPIWAQVDPRNQRFGNKQNHVSAPPPLRQQQSQSQPQTNHSPVQRGPHANSQLSLEDPPLDHELIHMRRFLGPWERGMHGTSQMHDNTRFVAGWLSMQLENLADIGNDPNEGAIEIEAKIGTLINQHDGMRYRSGNAATSHVIHPDANRDLRFESQMTMMEHRKMNEYLNNLTRASMTGRGRAPIAHKHLRENDSFRTLTDAGVRALPQVVHRLPAGRELKLRTTTDDATGQVKARILKIPLANLHISSPMDPYDCRISVNFEVNLNNRPDIDALICDPSMDKPGPPDRHKDRMSYRHMAYTVDLTRVDVKGNAPKFELECEVDAGLLREQAHAEKEGNANAYGQVVSDFLMNCTFLMRAQL